MHTLDASADGTHRLVRQPRLSDQVAADLRRQIYERQLRPGDALPSERELCQSYGVSRTVIREAVKSLTAKGLVNSVPGSGLMVGITTIEDVAEIFDLYFRGEPSLRYEELHAVRYSVEPTICALAAQHATADEIDEILDLCDELDEIGSADLVRASRNDTVFHRTIALASKNSYFVILLDALGRSLLDTRVATFSMAPQRVAVVSAAHRKIAEAIAQRDPGAAAEAMKRHLEEVLHTWHDGTPGS